MRNRAKCKQCGDVLESFHENDLIYCSCKEIAISGGSSHYYCWAENYKNFLRIDDEGNEIAVTYVAKNEEKKEPKEKSPLDPSDAINEMIANIENLPNHAKIEPCNQYDFLSLLYVVSSWMNYKKGV